MNSRQEEAFDKLIAAKRLEREAINLLIPEKMKRRLDVISGELKAMALDWLMDSIGEQVQREKETPRVEKASASKQVKRVPIG